MASPKDGDAQKSGIPAFNEGESKLLLAVLTKCQKPQVTAAEWKEISASGSSASRRFHLVIAKYGLFGNQAGGGADKTTPKTTPNKKYVTIRPLPTKSSPFHPTELTIESLQDSYSSKAQGRLASG
jgi:hypothetical protein